MPEYDFQSLSATDFERLARDVLNAELGLRLHCYPEGRDQGIDLREVTTDGHVTIGQCKHYPRSSRNKFLTAVSKETRKPALKLADRYILVTSHPLTPGLEDEVARILDVSSANVWGPDKINGALGRNSDVERQHFKLWLSSVTVLDEIVNAGLWQRAAAQLEDITSRAKYWVETPAYAQVRDLLIDEGVCIVTGEAGTGKTFLAERIVLESIRNDWQVIYLANDVKDAWAASRPEERQLFYYDDFLGQAELKSTATDDAPNLTRFISYVRRNNKHKRLIATTREHILTQASQAKSDRLKEIAGDPARYTLGMSTLEASTRAEILTNHLYFSDLPANERETLTIDTRLRAVIVHPAYSPSLIEAITKRTLAKATADELLGQLTCALANPTAVWETTFEVLNDLAKEIILTLATFPARPLRYRDLRDIAAPDDRPLAWQEAFKLLQPTWIQVTGADNSYVTFSNPGCRDYILGRLDDVDLAEDRVYQRLQRLEQLISLSQSAGLLITDSHIQPIVHRARLSDALMSRRSEFSVLIGEWWEEWAARSKRSLSQRLITLRDAAALSRVYGNSYTSTWLIRRITEVVSGADENKPPLCTEGLALARQLSKVPTEADEDRDDLVHALIVASLAGARTTRDLDAYEQLPDELRTSDIHEIACQHAARIIDSEVDDLLHEYADPKLLEESALALEQLARWYGHEIHINGLLERADELAAVNQEDEARSGGTSMASREDLAGIFSRIADS